MNGHSEDKLCLRPCGQGLKMSNWTLFSLVLKPCPHGLKHNLATLCPLTVWSEYFDFEKFLSTLTSLPKICQNDQTHAELSQTVEEYLQADLTHD